MTYTEWTEKSRAYEAYQQASERCEKAFHPATIATRAWTKPGSTETRHYLDRTDIATAAGLDTEANSLAGVEDNISKTNIRRILAHIDQAKYWVDADGGLHSLPATGAHWTYIEAIESGIRAATITR